jgi:hypothetical protein
MRCREEKLACVYLYFIITFSYFLKAHTLLIIASGFLCTCLIVEVCIYPDFHGRIEKIRIPKESPTRQNWKNSAGSVWLCLFMDGTVKCKLSPWPRSTGLRRSQHLTWTCTIFKHPQLCLYGGYHGTFNMAEIAIPWKVAHVNKKNGSFSAIFWRSTAIKHLWLKFCTIKKNY